MLYLFSLLTPESSTELFSRMGSSPIHLLDTPALYIAGSDEPFDAVEDASYAAQASSFYIGANPMTGNTSLFLNLLCCAELQHRHDSLDTTQHPVSVVLSDKIHAIPRKYRAFLNSIENSFKDRPLILNFVTEFIHEV